jgi:sulfur-carrier protein adenylyltransferase/sulfurtransferase
MKGGMEAWEGIAAGGFPEVLMALFPSTMTDREVIALAWLMEDGTRRFYDAVSMMLDDRVTAGLFRDLASAEEKHKSLLSSLDAEFAGGQARTDDLTGRSLSERTHEPFMEGGIRLQEALSWLPGKPAKAILEISVGLETNAYDRYLNLAHTAGNQHSQRLFGLLSREEKQHLQRLTVAFEQMI